MVPIITLLEADKDMFFKVSANGFTKKTNSETQHKSQEKKKNSHRGLFKVK